MVIYQVTEKTNKYHISKLFDITTNNVEKPSIMIFNPYKIDIGTSFEKVKPGIPRCTSFADVLQVFWDEKDRN
jgi:hypothetical protein